MATPAPEVSPVVPPAPLATPDPIMTSEALAVAVVAFISNIYVLFIQDGLTDAQKTGIAGLITGGWLIGQFLYSAWIRSGRAKALGLGLAAREVTAVTANPPAKPPGA